MQFDDPHAGHVQGISDDNPRRAFLARLLDELRAVLPCVSELSEFIDCGHASMLPEFTSDAQEREEESWAVL